MYTNVHQYVAYNMQVDMQLIAIQHKSLKEFSELIASVKIWTAQNRYDQL